MERIFDKYAKNFEYDLVKNLSYETPSLLKIKLNELNLSKKRFNSCADLGCGTGRWAKLVAPKVGKLHCIDPSSALDVARSNLSQFNNFDTLQAGSSLKFCMIAEGLADLYPRLGPTSEWDIAAGHIILEEAGGFLKTFENKSIKYNSKESLINPEFLASCKII